MCVIAYKAKEKKFPTEKRVREMWTANPDGAGVMWRDNNTNKIHFVKGFMRLKKLEQWIKENREWLEEVECALHFRITTHGGTSQGNTHPFVCDNDVDPHLLQGEADYVMMHNGVLPIVPSRADISDSGELALRIGAYANPMDIMDILDPFVKGNRILVMGKEGTMTYGDNFVTVGDDGILYSNDNFDLDFGDYYGWGDRHYGFYHPVIGAPTTTTSEGKDDAGENPSDGATKGECQIIWDSDQCEFVNPYTEDVIPIGDVDPDMLSARDYEIYLDLTSDDEDVYSPELIEEAHYYGMSVKEYLEYCYEGRGKNGEEDEDEEKEGVDVEDCL